MPSLPVVFLIQLAPTAVSMLERSATPMDDIVNDLKSLAALDNAFIDLILV